jgi:ABC-2 type transport system permease protein
MNLFWIQLKGELRKLFSRRRTYIGFVVFLAVELLVLRMMQLDGVKRTMARMIAETGYGAEAYLGGATLAFFVLLSTVMLLGGLYLALVSGDIVSKEVEDGTMRMLLCRPCSRGRILAIKFIACGVYTAFLMTFLALSALAAGLLWRGTGGMFVFAPQEKVFALHDFAPGMVRYFAAIPLLSLGLFSISAVGFFFSCLRMKPAAATTVTLSFFFVDSIMRNIPYFDSLREYFVTTRVMTWVNVFQYHVPWERMLEDYAWLSGMNATLFVVAWVIFERRDFKG